MHWVEAISALSSLDKSFVIVTIISVEGSAPRDANTKMIVDELHIYDTIGGGNLEYQAIELARSMLTNDEATIVRETFALGKDLAQCCGGKVELLFECIPAKDFNIVLFGAGHVGNAVIRILSELDCKVKWIDSRDEFIEANKNRDSESKIELVKMRNPEIEVEESPSNAYYLVMTHSHELDMQLVEAILSRKDVRFCGLIGSKSKAAKFRNRLARKKFNNQEINRLISPIGLEQVKGKRPMEVAVSITGQLISLRQDQQLSLKSSQQQTNTNIQVNNVVEIANS